MPIDWIDEALQEWARDYRGGMPHLGTTCILGDMMRIRGKEREPSAMSALLEGCLCEMARSRPDIYRAIEAKYLLRGVTDKDRAMDLGIRKTEFRSRVARGRYWLEGRLSAAGIDGG